MTKVVVVLDQDGKFENVFADTEIHLSVLRRGKQDNQIDKTETELEVVEI